MPIAGSNVEVFHLYVKDNRLTSLGKHRYPSHLVEDRILVAVDMLIAGKPVFLQALGENLVNVKAALRERGVDV
jgi:hypothetical protein